MKTNSAREKSKLLSQTERDEKFCVQNSPSTIRPVHSFADTGLPTSFAMLYLTGIEEEALTGTESEI